MSGVKGTFTGTGQSEKIQINTSGALSISGTFVATIELERSLDGGATWAAVDSGVFTLVAEKIVDGGSSVWFRLNCTAYTSGTVIYSLG